MTWADAAGLMAMALALALAFAIIARGLAKTQADALCAQGLVRDWRKKRT